MTKPTPLIPPSVSEIARTARDIFTEDGHLRPMVFLESSQGTALLPVSFENPGEKDMVASMIRAAARALRATAVIMVTESWTLHIPPELSAEEQKAAINLASKQGLANHPNRQEVIMVAYETKAGQQIGLMRITREGKKATVGELEWTQGMNGEGRFSGFLKEVSNG